MQLAWPARWTERDAGRPRIPTPADTTLQGALGRLAASPDGLTSEQAARQLLQHGPNRLRDDDGNHPIAVLFRQFRSPMVLILLGAAILSFVLGETDEATIVAIIVLASTG